LKFGVIGYGSIGQRHVRNLIALGYDDIVLFRKIGSGNEHNLLEYNKIQKFIDAQLDTVIIANPTSLHAEYLKRVLAQDIHVLAEKPLVATLEEWQSLQDQLMNYIGIGMTAYNMRFHPCVREIQQILANDKLGKIYSARFFVGQYLPDWKPGTDYSKSYSASREMGGGVLFDLIHEIDLACQLVGEPTGPVSSLVDKVSELLIETEDLVELFYRTNDNSFVSIHLDCLTRGYQRYIEIVCEQGSLRADLFSNKVTVTDESGEVDSKLFPGFLWNDMYLDMLSNFINCIEKYKVSPISLQDGLISNRIAIEIRNEFYANA
jgi:predicted dehydrogenase